MSYNQQQRDRIGITTVTDHQGQVHKYNCTFHYISSQGVAVIRDGDGGNVANFPAGMWNRIETNAE